MSDDKISWTEYAAFMWCVVVHRGVIRETVPVGDSMTLTFVTCLKCGRLDPERLTRSRLPSVASDA